MHFKQNNITKTSYYLIGITTIAGLLSMAKSPRAENWPEQPLSPIMKAVPTIFNDPPYGKGRKFQLNGNGFFFKKAIHLKIYDKNQDSLQQLIKNKDVIEFLRNRELIAEENITSSRGRVFDQYLGSGYIVMGSTF